MAGDIAPLSEALRAAEEAGVPSVDAPDPDELWAALHGEAEPRRALEVVDAALRGPTGFEQVRLARAIENAITAPEMSRRAIVPLWTALIGIAAAVAASVVLFQTGPRDDDAVEYRGDPAAVVPKVELGAVLPADALVLRWEPGPPGRSTTSGSPLRKGKCSRRGRT